MFFEKEKAYYLFILFLITRKRDYFDYYVFTVTHLICVAHTVFDIFKL